jgi:two-component system phosphate regulon sensor histidine kinase PhoR
MRSYFAQLWARMEPRLRELGGRLMARRRLLAGLAAIDLMLTVVGIMPFAAAFVAMASTVALFLLVAPDDVAWWPSGPDRLSEARQRTGDRAGARLPHEESWRAVIDAMHDPVLALDDELDVLHHNPAVADLFPRARAGMPLTHMSRNPELIEAVDNARGRDEPVVVELKDRVPVSRRISAIITSLDRAPPPPGLKAREPALIVVFRDMTDQEKLAQMRADFIANASHELRTPLASLRGFVETLQGPARDDPGSRDRFLAIMATQAARMTRLIDDLLALSRAEMRVHLPPRGIVDLNDVLSFVSESMEPLAQANAITLTLTLPDGPANVRGERDELVQVFQNLVQNAIKYGKPGGHVDVKVTREAAGAGHAQRLGVAVMDDGPGIAEEHLPRLTERFYRVNVTQSREKGGTGLGLAIVKYIVNRHRGELRISSEVGKGSTFTVLLDETRSRTS